ncbi:hypothetical protein M2128_000728 [Polynucleobacter sphagniphilus]|jgi:hypothetical protein|uniref:DUF3047 domain-containing protein n=2 Tax=Polynucleobacter sphagniphilus TaxID=1743169 RepID=A0AA43S4B4_9BURK|nr:DUF3047 domain-containing protein [Polynucleobacter sphagniphilus]MDF9787323.1 hypothetical protein [Polynucleobacter sphagniphilus]MDH6154307.1 hypothetical protein [Polynucleobacter sphagniphilus]MDH6248127.1 hypothetical protein [Polynucleobacter sphagniphilus]MDH6300114.1 hypothetical protein [Polynucleobacter sphagniphilus]MDH6301811.1 hypothetical protein [Polynucleobacter sphagniphilus]
MILDSLVAYFETIVHMSSKSGFLLILTLCLLAGCAGFSRNSIQDESGKTLQLDQIPAQEAIPKFSAETARDGIPRGWQFYRIAPYKNNTVYRLENIQGKTVLSAKANTSASGLAVNLQPRPAKNLWLSWKWMAFSAIPQADNAEQAQDDSPLRILVAFEGDKSKLTLKEKLNFEMANLISGEEMPYATLMYIWSGKTPVNTVLDNAHTSRVKMIVVDSGWDDLNEWRAHDRDLVADYQMAFGEVPGKIIGVAILTDTDNTKTKTSAFYGDIELIKKSPK